MGAKKIIGNKGIFVSVYQQKRKKNYFENLDTKNVSDNKTFWKTVKALLSDKCTLPVNVTLVKEND